eukprot:19778-Heterococcus_DN1.PRE.6
MLYYSIHCCAILAEFSLIMLMYYTVMTHRVERYGWQLDALFVAVVAGFCGTAVAAVLAARAHRFIAHRRWALRHIAYGHGVSAQRLLLMAVGLLVPQHILAREENRRLLFALLTLADIALNAGMLELYFLVVKHYSSSGVSSTDIDKVQVSKQELQDLKLRCGDHVVNDVVVSNDVVVTTANTDTADARCKLE